MSFIKVVILFQTVRYKKAPVFIRQRSVQRVCAPVDVITPTHSLCEETYLISNKSTDPGASKMFSDFMRTELPIIKGPSCHNSINSIITKVTSVSIFLS